MKEYVYRFADGAKSVVEVTDELYDLLEAMDKEEKYGNRRNTRRHVSLERLAELSIEPSITDEYFADDMFGDMENEGLLDGLKTLTEKQKNIVAKAAIEGMSLRKTAEELGLNKETVREQYIAGIKKLEEFL